MASRTLSLTAVAATAAFVSAACLGGDAVWAQAGSIGGSIGKQNKMITGDSGPERGRDDGVRRPRPRRAATAAPRTRTAPRCPNIAGVWSSWASGIFGKGDTTFSADGTGVHRSGFRGRWWCESGQLHIAWPDGKPGVVKISDNGKIITGQDGRVHMSR
jgi:hypothetical protein